MLHRTFMRLNFVILILNLLLHLKYSKISIYMLENQEWYISLVYKVLYWFRIKLFLSFLTCFICHFETRFLNTEYRKYTKGENMRKVRLIQIFPNISGLGFNMSELKQKHSYFCYLNLVNSIFMYLKRVSRNPVKKNATPLALTNTNIIGKKGRKKRR